GDFEAAHQYAARGVQLWRSRGAQPRVEEVNSAAVACLCYEAVSEWHFGGIASCQATMAEVIPLAKELKDTHGLGEALTFAGALAHFERNPAEVDRVASELIELSTRQHFALWLAAGEVLRGWAWSASGSTAEGISWIEDGIRDYRATGATMSVPYWLALKAETLHLADR